MLMRDIIMAVDKYGVDEEYNDDICRNIMLLMDIMMIYEEI